MLNSRVVKNGSVTELFIDGKKTPPLAYTTYFDERSRFEDFADANYRIFFVNASFTIAPINSCGTGFTPFRVGIYENNDDPNYSDFDERIRKILSYCPDAFIFPRINVSMPKWWIDSHPDDVIPTPKGGFRETMFSEAFRRDGAELIKRFATHVKESDYQHRVAGWQLCAGQTQEWFHHDLNGSLGKNAEAPFRKWMKENYGVDNAELPTNDDFLYKGECYNDNENARRYCIFSNTEVAKTLDIFANTLKEETNRSQVVGAFYGYSMELIDHAENVLFGSHALREVIDSENLDFFSSPMAYTRARPFGIDWADMIPVDSLKLHGKLCFMECDVRTYLTKSIQECRPNEYPNDIYRTKTGVSVWSGPPTVELSRCALRKSFAHQLSKASAIWWFDMWGGWYDDPILMSELCEMKRIYEMEVSEKDRVLRPDIVMLADERAYANLKSYSPHLNSATRVTRTALGNVGAPYDLILVEDAERVLKNYKAAVFPFPIPSEAGKRAMDLCTELGIPYITATPEHHGLTVDDLKNFLTENGVHLYSEKQDVVYVGNGYLALHSNVGEMKTLKLPFACEVTPILGADMPTQINDTLEFYLPENDSAIFAVRPIKNAE